jgi:hypothetical protein
MMVHLGERCDSRSRKRPEAVTATRAADGARRPERPSPTAQEAKATVPEMMKIFCHY